MSLILDRIEIDCLMNFNAQPHLNVKNLNGLCVVELCLIGG